MRFLLHPVPQRAASVGIRSRNSNRASKRSSKCQLFGQPTAQDQAPSSTTLGSTSSNETKSALSSSNEYVKSWGQQCSPNCGCVVRFEATLDPSTNKFTSASYQAKAVVVFQTKHDESGNINLRPAKTLRNNRLMLQPCQCESLHALASQVTHYLPNRNALAFRSSMEFSGIRSSPAFRHTALARQGLSTKNTHCFDVVEEALTAMVKGYMPKSRPQISIKEAYASTSTASLSPLNFTRERGDLEAEDAFRIDMSTFMKPARKMSALRMLDMANSYSPFAKSIPEYKQSRYSSSSRKNDLETNKRLDWVTYVDELYEKYDDMMQKSA